MSSEVIRIENIKPEDIGNKIHRKTLICIKVKEPLLLSTEYVIYKKIDKEFNRICPGRFVNIKINTTRVHNVNDYNYRLHPSNYKYSVSFDKIVYKNNKIEKIQQQFNFDECSTTEYQATFTGNLFFVDDETTPASDSVNLDKEFPKWKDTNLYHVI